MSDEKFEWDYCLFSESRVVHVKARIVLLIVQLKGNTVYTKRKPWGSQGPSLLMTTGSKIVEDFATALTQTAVFISFIFSLLDTVTSQASCVSDSLTSMQTKRNPTGHQSPADSRQYKTTTTKHQSIHQLLIKIKTKRTNQQKDSFCYVCFRQSQGRSSDRDHGSDDP